MTLPMGLRRAPGSGATACAMTAVAALFALVPVAAIQGQEGRADRTVSVGNRAGLPRDLREVRLVSRAPESPSKHTRPSSGRREPPSYGHRRRLGVFSPVILVGVEFDGSVRAVEPRESVAPQSMVIDVAAVVRAQSLDSWAAATGDSAAAGGPPVRIESLAWMEGCWEATSPRRTIEERWTAPRAGSMLGTSRTTSNDSLLEHEFVALREMDGALVYQAQPSGQPAAEFRSTEITDSTAVFENPGHDFPQLIGYRRTTADSLQAWIEGKGRNGSRQVNFAYRRVACGP